jgi:glucose/arabinose dehydrogenase/PKD repeat protein
VPSLVIRRSVARLRRRRIVALLGTLFAAVLLTATGATPAAAVPAQFEDTLVTTVSGPMDVAWTPDGRMLIIGKGGQLRVFANGQLLATPALNLSNVLCTNGERGLVGLAVHPNFATNHFIYLYYTYNKFANLCPESEVDGPVNRLSRFVLQDSNVVDPASETVLFETPPMYRDHHTGGDPKFGKDGLLYVTVGDSGAQSLGWPQDLGRLAGKVVRITDSGGIPAGNPFTGAGTARCNLTGAPPAGSSPGTRCQEIFSSGLRNPFRLAHDPNSATVRYYINDVGQHTWEDISEGPVSGGNYGWPVREGPCAKDSDTDCGPAPAGMIDPVHWYHHGPDGAAATGGAFVPNGVWPAQYSGTYLFADYVFGTIYQLVPGGTRCLTCAPPTSAFSQPTFSTAAQVVSMRFGPYGNTQALYYVSRNNGEVRRIAYTGQLNRAPVAVATADPRFGAVPLTVNFDGTGSSDPDGDPLTYAWDFQGDGVVDSTAAAPTFTYSTAGTVHARLTVRDSSGAANSTTVRIDPGNTPPAVTIDSPAAGTRFAVGEQFVLHGTASDPQDGPLGASALTWEVIRHHATHTHPFLEPVSGNDIPITGPEPEDLDAAKDSYLEIRLTATDASGLSTTVSRRLDPKMVDLTFATEPTGLHLSVGGQTLTGPTTVRSWEGYAVGANAPDQTDTSGRFWAFGSWSDGGSRSHAITTPASPATYTARFVEATPPAPTTFTFPATADTYVSSAEPDRNFGTRSTVRTDASPDIRSYLRFDVTGLGGTVTGAKLRVFAASSNSIGVDARGVTDNGWGETTLTYRNQPGMGGVVGSSGRLTSGSWVEIALPTAGIANGPVSIGLSSTSNTATSLASREAGANTPQLIVTTAAGAADSTPPSTPTGLSATAVAAGRVDLSWTASTDNVAVSGYDVFRDGALLATTSDQTVYSDTAVAAGRSYTYQVRARDAAGNVSGLSAPAQATTPPGGGTLVLRPTDDSSVKIDSATTNFGAAGTLEVDNSPVKQFLLRFDLSAVGSQTVVGAKLRLHVMDSSTAGGSIHRTSGNQWSEATVTWNTAPALDTSVAPVSLGSVTAGTVVEIDVRSLLTAGVVSLRVTSSSSNGADYSAKEGTTAPELVLTLA